MIPIVLAALLALGTTPERGFPDPDAGTTAARADPGRGARPRSDADPELLRNLDLLEKLDLLQNLELFDEGR